MPDLEARDAFLAVEVPLPNGAVVRGKPVPWRMGMRLAVQLNEFLLSGDQKQFDTLFAEFASATGVTEAELQRLAPDLSFGELVDFLNRFFYRRRPARTVAPSPMAPADPTSAPPSV